MVYILKLQPPRIEYIHRNKKKKLKQPKAEKTISSHRSAVAIKSNWMRCDRSGAGLCDDAAGVVNR